uniref:RRM domain-containing protein n=2 Tax=Setaria TaxID=4554 RepID=K3XY68_SETIT
MAADSWTLSSAPPACIRNSFDRVKYRAHRKLVACRRRVACLSSSLFSPEPSPPPPPPPLLPVRAPLLLPPPRGRIGRMADALDMSLDDLISKNKNKQPRPSGRGPTSGGGGPAPTAPRRRFNARAAAAPYHRGTTSPFQARRPMAYAGYGAGRLQAAPMAGVLEEPTRLYISNLDYAVSNDDIKELFSDVGDIKRYSINYDRSGRSKGTAEVVFSRRSDALAAVKRYNNVQLDGKPMKIEIIGTNIEAPPTPTFAFNPPAGNFKVPFTSGPRRGGGGGWPQGRGGFGGRGRGPASRGRGRGGGRGSEKVSAEDLDADLDKYHAAAMETS